MTAAGEVIRRTRKNLGLTQKDLAARVKKADGTPISAPYLNDIELGHRNPPAYLLDNLAKELKLPPEYLRFLCGLLPADIPGSKNYDVEQVERAFEAFRKALRSE